MGPRLHTKGIASPSLRPSDQRLRRCPVYYRASTQFEFHAGFYHTYNIMDYLPIVLLAAILLVLIAAVFELRKINEKLSRLPAIASSQSEKSSGGATTNVYVGALQPSIEKPISIFEHPVTPTATTAPSSEELLAEKPEPPKDAANHEEPAPRKSTDPSRIRSNGLSIIKCPSCGSENSSFRFECFKCGTKLS